jgi:hypothetical protein
MKRSGPALSLSATDVKQLTGILERDLQPVRDQSVHCRVSSQHGLFFQIKEEFFSFYASRPDIFKPIDFERDRFEHRKDVTEMVCVMLLLLLSGRWALS